MNTRSSHPPGGPELDSAQGSYSLSRMNPGPTIDATDLSRMAPEGEDRTFLIVHVGDRARVLELHDGVDVTLGRSRSATVLVDHEKASRMHARVVRRGADIVVEDLGSRNGTRVNGVKILAPTRVTGGDEIGVADVVAFVAMSTRLRRRAVVGSASFLEDRLAAEVDRAVRYRRPLGLLMLRVEGGTTDAVLERMVGVLRRMDILCEYGPDELAIIVPEADREGADAAARVIARAARGPGDEAAVHVGLATYPDDGAEAEELVSRARAALRRARAGGGRERVAAAPVEAVPAPGDLVVADPQMVRVYETVRKVADAPITVLILGETGTGKELVAEALHRLSKRGGRPFVKLNCASLPETLLESELFGHERGAFTGAVERKLGYFEAAAGGTLFLDEVGEMPLALQAKLLRVLEARTITRVGGTKEISVDVRVVCATHRDLEQEVERKRFRQDLYFRMSAFTLLVPPLRNRRVEIRPLAEHFAREFAAELRQPTPVLAPAALQTLEAYAWPGNVRELRNAIERAVVLSQGSIIDRAELPDKIRDAGGGAIANMPTGDGVDVRGQLAEVERGAIVAALEACGGNQTQAARRLGLSRRALIYKLEKYGLKPQPAKGAEE